MFYIKERIKSIEFPFSDITSLQYLDQYFLNFLHKVTRVKIEIFYGDILVSLQSLICCNFNTPLLHPPLVRKEWETYLYSFSSLLRFIVVLALGRKG